LLAWGLSELGEFEEAKKWAREGIELTEQVKNVFSTVFINACSGETYLLQGKLEDALGFFEEAHGLAIDADLSSLFSFTGGGLGRTYLKSDRADDALPILEEAVKPENLDSSLLSSIYPIVALSEAYRLTGQLAKASLSAGEALRIYRQTDEHCFGARALLVMAKIQSENSSGQIEQAMQKYRQAKEMSEKLKMRPLLAHCCLELGQFYIRSGEYEKARTELIKTIDLYRSLDMELWLPKAETILSKLS